MRAETAPDVVAVMKFIECVNRGDAGGLDALMTDQHTLHVFHEPPLVGRAAVVEAWRGYIELFPDYVIYPHEFTHAGGGVAVLGHTTGSHLALSDDEESQITLIWFTRVERGRLRLWRLLEDTPRRRREFGFDLQ